MFMRTKAFPWGKVDFPICPYRDDLEKTDEGYLCTNSTCIVQSFGAIKTLISHQNRFRSAAFGDSFPQGKPWRLRRINKRSREETYDTREIG